MITLGSQCLSIDKKKKKPTQNANNYIQNSHIFFKCTKIKNKNTIMFSK